MSAMCQIVSDQTVSVYKEAYCLVLRSKRREAVPQNSKEQIIHKLLTLRMFAPIIFTFMWANSKISLQVLKNTPNKEAGSE